MNEQPLASPARSTRLEDLDLFGQALNRLCDDGGPISDASLVIDNAPRLSLVRPEDHDDCPVIAGDSTHHQDVFGDSLLDQDTAEPWLDHSNDNTTESHFDRTTLSPAQFHGLDESAAECIAISNPLVEQESDFVEPVNELFVAETSAPTVVNTSIPRLAPARIGAGRLAPAKLNWKPGDPFGCSDDSSRGRFRWELMLTTACATAICGLACMWLLRTVFA